MPDRSQSYNSTLVRFGSKAKKINKKIYIKNYKLDPFTGAIDIRDLQDKLTNKTKFVILTHAHNVFGIVNPINQILVKLPQNTISVLDMAQSAGHIPINFANLGVNVALFSGHKMFALENIGGILVDDETKQKFEQVKFGGGVEKNIFPYNLEVGTKNSSGIYSLGLAIDFINSIKIENIQKQVDSLTLYLLKKLQTIRDIEFMAGISFNQKLENTGIISFKTPFESDKLEYLLNQNNINIRIGKHCTEELPDSIRISLHIYNNQEDIDKFIEILENAKNI